jgi:hypothetical protein
MYQSELTSFSFMEMEEELLEISAPVSAVQAYEERRLGSVRRLYGVRGSQRCRASDLHTCTHTPAG